MTNIKAPIFWAWTGLFLYLLLLSVFVMIFTQSSFSERLIFVILDVGLITTAIILLFRRNLSEKAVFVIVPLILSPVWMCAGSFVLYVMLHSPPVIYSRPFMDDHPTQYFAFAAAAMLPFGIVIFLLSMISLISMRNKKFI